MNIIICLVYQIEVFQNSSPWCLLWMTEKLSCTQRGRCVCSVLFLSSWLPSVYPILRKCGESGIAFCDHLFYCEWRGQQFKQQWRALVIFPSSLPLPLFPSFPYPSAFFPCFYPFDPTAGNLIKQGVSWQITEGERLVVVAGTGKAKVFGVEEELWMCSMWTLSWIYPRKFKQPHLIFFFFKQCLDSKLALFAFYTFTLFF